MRTRGRITSMLGCALLVVGCGVSATEEGAGLGTSTTTASADPLTAREVLARVGGSVALVDTPIATGSAVLTEGGYVVTNAHVVDPFGVADLTFEGEDTILDVEVVGVDLDADVAVLGPVETEQPPLPIADPDDLERGSELFLVGFPGDQDDEELTITSGILSRRRQLEAWDLTYLQSDAKIAGGQSGGALVDDRGRVVGISGLSDDDDYALSLAGDDVAAAVERITSGDGSAWSPAPRVADDEAATFAVTGELDHRLLYLPAAPRGRTVTVGVEGPEPLVQLVDASLYSLALNEAAYDAGGVAGFEVDDLPEPTEPDRDGRYTFDLEGGLPALLALATGVDEPATLDVTSTEPFEVVAGDLEPEAIEVDGDPVEGTLGSFDHRRLYELDLAEGERLDVEARSAVGDVAYTIAGPEETLASGPEEDDGGGGLFDLDAAGTYTAEVSGRHRLWVYQVDGYATGYRLRVRRG